MGQKSDEVRKKPREAQISTCETPKPTKVRKFFFLVTTVRKPTWHKSFLNITRKKKESTNRLNCK